MAFNRHTFRRNKALLDAETHCEQAWWYLGQARATHDPAARRGLVRLARAYMRSCIVERRLAAIYGEQSTKSGGRVARADRKTNVAGCET